MENVYQKLLRRLEESSESHILSTKLSKKGRGDVAEFEREIDAYLTEEEKKELLLSGKPGIFARDTYDIYAEPYYKKERMVIFGGGHVALPLAKFAKMTGMYVVVIDDRKEFANRERFPDADEVICSEYTECLKFVKPTVCDYFVAVTRGHVSDSVCIRELMKYPESVYTGMIGSKNRKKIVLEELEAEGYDRERLHRICAPIGLEIGAMTTEEIGISIMAEVIRRKRIESKDNILISRSDGDSYVIEQLAKEKEPFCAVTIMQAVGSAPRYAGARMMVYPDKRIVGTIGGGKVELRSIEKAVSFIGTGAYEVRDISLAGADAMAEGMACGGSVKMLFEDFAG